MHQLKRLAKGTRLEAEGRWGDKCGCPEGNTRDWTKGALGDRWEWTASGTGADRAEGWTKCGGEEPRRKGGGPLGWGESEAPVGGALWGRHSEKGHKYTVPKAVPGEDSTWEAFHKED